MRFICGFSGGVLILFSGLKLGGLCILTPPIITNPSPYGSYLCIICEYYVLITNYFSPSRSLPLYLLFSRSFFLLFLFSGVYCCLSEGLIWMQQARLRHIFRDHTRDFYLSLSPSHILVVSDGVWCARIHPLSTLFHQTGVVGDMELLGEEEGKGERRLFIRRLHTRWDDVISPFSTHLFKLWKIKIIWLDLFLRYYKYYFFVKTRKQASSHLPSGNSTNLDSRPLRQFPEGRI